MIKHRGASLERDEIRDEIQARPESLPIIRTTPYRAPAGRADNDSLVGPVIDRSAAAAGKSACLQGKARGMVGPIRP